MVNSEYHSSNFHDPYTNDFKLTITNTNLPELQLIVPADRISRYQTLLTGQPSFVPLSSILYRQNVFLVVRNRTQARKNLTARGQLPVICARLSAHYYRPQRLRKPNTFSQSLVFSFETHKKKKKLNKKQAKNMKTGIE